MWPYGSIEPPLGEQRPTYADLLEVHWDALPLRRKAEILLYLARRLVRYAPREIATHSAAFADDVRITLRQWSQGIADAAATLRWALTPEGRYAIGDFIESLATYRAARSTAPFVALAILICMMTGPDLSTAFRSSTDRSAGHDSIVEQARAVRHYYPPRCYYEADGDVIVMDSTWRAIRASDPQRNRLLAQFCR